jgi:hypothetical protein
VQDNSNSNFSEGLEVVELAKKRAYPDVKISTYKTTFGTVLKVGTTKTSLSKDVVDMITDQENLKMLWR